jgi:hypothetical protein
MNLVVQSCVSELQKALYNQSDAECCQEREEKSDSSSSKALLYNVSFLCKMVRIITECNHICHQTGYRAARQANDDDNLEYIRTYYRDSQHLGL